MAASEVEAGGGRALNFNIGILGHVDSGKTTLAKCLSTLQSTASFDKSRQSQERGMTLDLGFSAFERPILADERPDLIEQGYSSVRFTLVDCPGHASLIRTVLGGAQIIDLMMLVVDATHGIQTQTAECMIIGELLTDQLLVVLNKVDLFEEDPPQQILRAKRGLRRKVAGTKFGSAPIIALSALRPAFVPEVAAQIVPRGEGRGGRGRGRGRGGSMAGAEAGGLDGLENTEDGSGVEELMRLLVKKVKVRSPPRPSDPFLFMTDHCFPVKGHGTVLTGTVLSGQVAVNSSVEIPALKLQKKIKSMQVFRQPVKSAVAGDRVAICFAQFDPQQLERGLLSSPGLLVPAHSVVFPIHPIRYFKHAIRSYSLFHVTVGHATIMGKLLLFSRASSSTSSSASSSSASSSASSSSVASSSSSSSSDDGTERPYSPDEEYLFQESITGETTSGCFALLHFENGPMLLPPNSRLIGSKLDENLNEKICRLAFHGLVSNVIDPTHDSVRVYKVKHKEGRIERIVDSHTAIVKDMFKRETDFDLFIGLTVTLPDGEQGVIQSMFGKAGKFKAFFPSVDLNDSSRSSNIVTLTFKHIISTHHHMYPRPKEAEKLKKLRQ